MKFMFMSIQAQVRVSNLYITVYDSWSLVYEKQVLVDFIPMDKVKRSLKAKLVEIVTSTLEVV